MILYKLTPPLGKGRRGVEVSAKLVSGNTEWQGCAILNELYSVVVLATFGRFGVDDSHFAISELCNCTVRPGFLLGGG